MICSVAAYATRNSLGNTLRPSINFYQVFMFAGEGIGYPLQYSWASLVAQQVKKKSACNMGDLGSVLGLGRSLGEGHGYPFQYSCLENSMGCIIHGVTKSQIQLSKFHCHYHDCKVTVKLNLE